MPVSIGKAALAFASLVFGAQYLRTGFKQLSIAFPKTEPLPGMDGLGFAGGKPARDSGFVKTHKGPMRMRTYNIRSLEDRIKYLRGLVDEGKRDPAVYAFVREAISRKCGGDWCIKEKDNQAEARAIFDETRRRVRYTSDIAGVDTYQKPAHTLALKSGDCDDFSSLLCSALLSAGIPCRFKVIRTVGGNDWNHIYVQAGFPRANPKKWVSLDASVPSSYGWEAPRRVIADERVFPVR